MTTAERHPTGTNSQSATSTDPPCDLGRAERAAQLAWIQREIGPHVVETVRLDDGVAIELVDSPALRTALDRLVVQERACCPTIGWARVASAVPGRVRLEVRGIDAEAPWLRELLAQPAARRPSATPGATRRRLYGAAGTGVITSLVVCCALPAAAVALLGAGVAAPLAALDAPGPIAAAAVFAGGLAWWRMARRAARAGVCGSDC